MTRQDVVITGIGLVSSLGEGPDAHWEILSKPGAAPVVDEAGDPDLEPGVGRICAFHHGDRGAIERTPVDIHHPP